MRSSSSWRSRREPHAARVRQVCGLDALVRAVAARDTRPTCRARGLRLARLGHPVRQPRPADLHPFRELRSGNRFAPSTPGDLLLPHSRRTLRPVLRAGGTDHGADWATAPPRSTKPTVSAISTIATSPVSSTAPRIPRAPKHRGHDRRRRRPGVRRWQLRDGPEVPARPAAWDRLSTETQENIIGRTKLEDIELDDSVKPSFAHNALTQLVENGTEVKILRHNMPFGQGNGG